MNLNSNSYEKQNCTAKPEGKKPINKRSIISGQRHSIGLVSKLCRLLFEFALKQKKATKNAASKAYD